MNLKIKLLAENSLNSHLTDEIESIEESGESFFKSKDQAAAEASRGVSES